MTCARTGNVAAVRALLDAGANPSAAETWQGPDGADVGGGRGAHGGRAGAWSTRGPTSMPARRAGSPRC